jgi:predicted DNA-binding transcriptional regulator YafY
VVCVARDVAAGLVRAFRIEHVEQVEVSAKRFELPPDFDVHDHDHGAFGVGATAPLAAVIVEFDASVAADVRTRRLHRTQRVAAAPDGRIRVAFSVPDLDPVVGWVLSFGPTARAVEPPELVSRVRDALSRALRRY